MEHIQTPLDTPNKRRPFGGEEEGAEEAARSVCSGGVCLRTPPRPVAAHPLGYLLAHLQLPRSLSSLRPPFCSLDSSAPLRPDCPAGIRLVSSANASAPWTRCSTSTWDLLDLGPPRSSSLGSFRVFLGVCLFVIQFLLGDVKRGSVTDRVGVQLKSLSQGLSIFISFHLFISGTTLQCRIVAVR